MHAPVVLFSPQSPDESGASGPTTSCDVPGERDMADTLKQRAREAAEEVKSTAADVGPQVKERGAAYASEGKTAVAERIRRAGGAIHHTADMLEAEDANMAWFTRRAAERLERTADYLRGRDFAGLRADAEGLARRHPGVALGGAFMAGIVVAGLLKAGWRAGASSDSGENEESGDTPVETPDSRPRSAAETTVPDDAEQVRESGPVPMGQAGIL